MKKYIRNTAIALMTATALFSCDKFLEESPKDKLPEDEVYNNLSDLYLNAVASLYTYIGGYSDSHHPHPWRRLVRRRILARIVPAPMGN